MIARGVLAVLLVSLSLCAIALSQEIVIGVVQPITGKFAEYGSAIFRGVSMAYEEMPKVLNRPVKLMALDNYSDKAQADKVVERLIKEFKAVAIIGTYDTSLNLPSADVANRNKVVYVVPTDTSPLATKDRPYVFRICFNDNLQATALAQFAVRNLGAKTAAILYESTSDYSLGLAYAFREAFTKETKNPKSIVANETYKAGDRDFRNQLSKISAAKPDVIFAPASGAYEGALIANQARKLGLKQTLLGSDTWDAPIFFLELESNVEGIYFTSMFDASTKLSDKTPAFVEKFRDRFGGQASYLVAHGYDAYMVIVDAIRRANSANPEDIRRAMIATNYTGVTGLIRFDQNRDAVKDVIIKTVKGGKIQTATVFKVQ